MQQDQKVIELSKAFAAVLREWLTPEQMEAVIDWNKQNKDSGCCATHDYCDANMAMDEAFTKTFGREFVFYNDEFPRTEQQNETDTNYFNAAWTLAKENEFSI